MQLKQVIRQVRKENKFLQKQVEVKGQQQQNSDSDSPPWERRKLVSQLLENETFKIPWS